MKELVPVMNWFGNYWRDIVSVGSAIFTIAGFVYALQQLRITKDAAVAAKESAEKTHKEIHEHVCKYITANILKLMTEVRLHIDNDDWVKAYVRLGDLADQAVQLGRTDYEWKELVIEIRSWETTIRSISRSNKKFIPQKWDGFARRLQAKVDAAHTPFHSPKNEGLGNDSE